MRLPQRLELLHLLLILRTLLGMLLDALPPCGLQRPVLQSQLRVLLLLLLQLLGSLDDQVLQFLFLQRLLLELFESLGVFFVLGEEAVELQLEVVELVLAFLGDALRVLEFLLEGSVLGLELGDEKVVGLLERGEVFGHQAQFDQLFLGGFELVQHPILLLSQLPLLLAHLLQLLLQTISALICYS